MNETSIALMKIGKMIKNNIELLHFNKIEGHIYCLTIFDNLYLYFCEAFCIFRIQIRHILFFFANKLVFNKFVNINLKIGINQTQKSPINQLGKQVNEEL